MYQSIYRTMTFALMSALALSANSQTATNTTANPTNAQAAQAATQANPNPAAANNAQANPANPAAKATKTHPGVNQIANPNQTQPAQTSRARVNQNVITQPNLQTQPAPVVNVPGQIRTGTTDPSIQRNSINLQNRALIQGQAQQRTAFRPQVLRGPDVGLWFNPTYRDRLVINDVVSTGPFARLGFVEGDQIVSVNGRPVVAEPDFMQLVSANNANPVEVVVMRNGQNQRIVVDPTILTNQENFVAEVQPLQEFGVVLDDRFNDRVVVWQVLPQSPAFYAGFRPGDVVTTLSGQPFRTRTDFENAVVGLQAGQANVQVRRGERTRDLIVDVPQFTRTAQRNTLQPRAADRIEGRGAIQQSDNNQKRNQPQNTPAAPNLKTGAGERSEKR